MTSNDRADIIIVIPSLNPDNNIIKLVSELKDKNFNNIIIVNDGSALSYKKYFKILEKEYHCMVLKHSVNLGKGRALKTAFNYILTEVLVPVLGVITVDSDGQHSINDIERIADELYHLKNSIILGCRKFNLKTIPIRSRFGNIMTVIILKILCGIRVTDSQTGLRGIPFLLLPKMMLITGERYEYEMNMIIESSFQNYGIKEISIDTIYINSNETSHFHPLFDSIRIYKVFIKYALASILTVSVDFSAFYLTLRYSQNILISTYIGRIFSAIINFIINRNLVFKSKGSYIKELIKYITLVFISGSCSAFIIYMINLFINIEIIQVKVIAESIMFLVNFYIQKNYIFGEHYRE